MKQALALKLQQEIRDKEQSVMTASLMISQDLSPPKAEKDGWKILDSEKIQKAAAEARDEVSFCHTLQELQEPVQMMVQKKTTDNPLQWVCGVLTRVWHHLLELVIES